MKGKIYLIAGPSGVGKGTVVKKILSLDENVAVSVSATTRDPRDGEVDGVNYFFMDRDGFEQLIKEDGFLEYAEYAGNYYGTPKKDLFAKLESGLDVILEIEVQGCMQVMEKLPEVDSVFLLPPSLDELEKRLRGRQSESEEVIEKRLSIARKELAQKEKFKYNVVNNTVDDAANEILDIIRAARTAD